LVGTHKRREGAIVANAFKHTVYSWIFADVSGLGITIELRP
jgi:hypothetical protein